MTADLTVPAVEAVLAFHRQTCETCDGAGRLLAWDISTPPEDRTPENQERCDCIDCDAGADLSPLSEWVTVDDEPMVECETCEGIGAPGDEIARFLLGVAEGTESDLFDDCDDCGGGGRRPLRAGDRVEIVAGELPTGDCTCTPCTTPAYGAPGYSHCAACCMNTGIEQPDPFCPIELHREWAENCGASPLPAPGTVLGTATVEWAGPIYDDADSNAEADWTEPLALNDNGRIYVYDSLLTNQREITDHEHRDWTPGRWAVRLTDTEAAK